MHEQALLLNQTSRILVKKDWFNIFSASHSPSRLSYNLQGHKASVHDETLYLNTNFAKRVALGIKNKLTNAARPDKIKPVTL